VICTQCNKDLPATTEFFYKSKINKNGFNSACKKCVILITSKWSKNNKEKHQEANRKSEIRKMAEGKCKCCSNIRLINSNLYCEKHWYRQESLKAFKTVKYWDFLKSLAEKQNYKCIYTDNILIPGRNMSLDHIISVYNHSELRNNINNVQWVTKDINMIKNKLNHNEFIELCRNISNKFCN
jgi:hypothetical protein